MCYFCAQDKERDNRIARKKRNGLKRRKRKQRSQSNFWKEVEKCDRVFSALVRLKEADEKGEVKCYTCGETGFWKQDGIQCGHYMGRGNITTRWYLPNARPQCQNCNENLKGNLVKYAKRLTEEHGEQHIVDLSIRAKQVSEMTATDIRELRLNMQKQVKKIREEKGL